MLDKRKLLALTIIATTSVALSGCGAGGSSGGGGGDTIKVGAVFPQSGDLAFSGQRGLQGVQIAADLINKSGGVNGKTLEITAVDASTPATAQSGVQQLITRDGIKILVGSTASSIGSVAAPAAERLNALYWETSAIADSITTSDYPHVFRTITMASGQGAYAGTFAAEELSKKLGKAPPDLKVAVLYTDDSYGSGIAAAEQTALRNGGVTQVTAVPYTAGSMKDFTPVILNLKNQNIDVVYQAGQLPDSLLFWRQSQQLGYTPKAALGTGSGYAEQGFTDTLRKVSDGIFNVVPPTPQSINVSAQSASAQKLYADFQGAVKTAGYTETSNMDWAFMGAWTLFHDVMPKAKSMSADDLAAAAHSIDIPAEDTITGYGVKFGPSGSKNAGQNTLAFPVVQQWQNGQLKVVFPAKVASAKIIDVPLPPLGTR